MSINLSLDKHHLSRRVSHGMREENIVILSSAEGDGVLDFQGPF